MSYDQDKYYADLQSVSVHNYRQQQQQQQEEMSRFSSSGPGLIDMVFGIFSLVFSVFVTVLKVLIWLIVEPIKWFAKFRRGSM